MGFDLPQELAQNDYARILHVSMSSALRRSLIMLFQPNLLGQVTVDENTVLNFPNGLPGFESRQRFKLFHEELTPRVFWMQSLDDADVLFSVVTPEEFGVRYEVELQRRTSGCAATGQAGRRHRAGDDLQGNQEIDAKHPSAAEVLSANLRNPLVINTATLRGADLSAGMRHAAAQPLRQASGVRSHVTITTPRYLRGVVV